jgi:hypothetical protein
MMKLHCVYCRATLDVQTILFDRADPDEQARRLEFEDAHDTRFGGRCGEKALGMILNIPDNLQAVSQ